MPFSELICILTFIAVSFENPATTVDFFPQTTAKSRNIIYLHTTVWCLVVMIVSIGVTCKEIGPSLSLVLIKMAKIWKKSCCSVRHEVQSAHKFYLIGF